MERTSHQVEINTPKSMNNQAIRHMALISYLFTLVTYFCNTLGFWRVLGSLRRAWDPLWAPLGPWPGPPQGAKDPLGAQCMAKVSNKYGQI